MGLIRVLQACILLGQTVLALTSFEIADYLKESLSSGSSVHLTNDTNPTNQIEPRWDLFAPPTYSVAVKPALPVDIQRIVSI